MGSDSAGAVPHRNVEKSGAWRLASSDELLIGGQLADFVHVARQVRIFSAMIGGSVRNSRRRQSPHFRSGTGWFVQVRWDPFA